MKLAFSSNAFKKFSLERFFTLISQIGYSAIEILCDVPHAYPPVQQDVLRIRDLLSKHNLEISNLNAFSLHAIKDTYHPSWIEDIRKFRKIRSEHTKNCIDLAKKLRCRNISTEAGGPFHNNTGNKTLMERRFRNEINALARFAEERDIKVLIEPEPGLLLESSSDFLTFMKTVESEYVRLNFDIAHFYCVGEDPAEVVHQLSDFIEHIHLSDIAVNRFHNHLIPGEGSIDFKSVFKAITDFGYKGFVTVELYPYQDDPVSAATKSYEFLRDLELDL